MGEFIYDLIVVLLISGILYLLVSVLLWVVARDNVDYHVHSYNKLGSFIIRIFNPVRQIFGKTPIWIVPDSRYENDYLRNAIRLGDEIRNSLKRLRWSHERKNNITRQIHIICENITKALWKLSALQQSEEVIEQFGKGDKEKGLQEIRTLEVQIKEEINHALEVLTPFSVYLAKLAATGASTPSEINSLISQIETSGQKIVEVIQSNGQKFMTSAPYSSVWSYTIIFVIVVATFSISSMFVPDYAFAITVAGSLLGLLVIGILKLRDTDKISENSFTRIVIEFLKSIRFLK